MNTINHKYRAEEKRRKSKLLNKLARIKMNRNKRIYAQNVQDKALRKTQ